MSGEGGLLSNKNLEFKQAFNTKSTEMLNEAKRLGVTVVPFRRFVELIGYKLPKGAGVTRRFRYDVAPTKPEAAKDSKEPAKKDDTDK